MGHAIGLGHEHQHFDRDGTIIIRFDRIPAKDHIWYKKFTSKTFKTWGVPYDYMSVMHYYLGEYMEARDPRLKSVIGSAKHLSAYDKYIVNRIYGCNTNPGNTNTGGGTPARGGQYDMRSNTRLSAVSGYIKGVYTNSPSACGTECNKISNCLVYQWQNRQCFMYSVSGFRIAGCGMPRYLFYWKMQLILNFSIVVKENMVKIVSP